MAKKIDVAYLVILASELSTFAAAAGNVRESFRMR